MEDFPQTQASSASETNGPGAGGEQPIDVTCSSRAGLAAVEIELVMMMGSITVETVPGSPVLDSCALRLACVSVTSSLLPCSPDLMQHVYHGGASGIVSTEIAATVDASLSAYQVLRT